MNNVEQRHAKLAERGFSLIEIMAVVVIIGILGTVVGMVVTNRISRARVTTTKSTIETVNNALRTFKMDTGQYPDKLDALVEKPSGMSESEWHGPYIEHYPLDGWENPLIYKKTEKEGVDFIVKSLGADNEPGGTEEDKDISNLTIKKERQKKRKRN